MISIRKRGQVYQYSFEIPKVDGKRKRKSKSGFKTKKEAMKVGIIEYNSYFNNGFNTRDEKISYSDYLDLWIEDYKQNMKYNTVRTYKSIIEKYLKPNLGQYRLSGITSYQLNNFITELCNKYDYSRNYIRNIVNVNIKMYKFLKIRMYKSVHFYFQLFPFFSFASINLSFNL